MSRFAGSPDKKAVLISAPQIFQRREAHMVRIRCFVSFRRVGESVAMRPSSGSCQPTNTNLAFGVLVRSSGSLLFFQTSTHLALIILSVGIPFRLQSEVTLFSIQEFHSFCIAFSNNFLSSGDNFLKETSTRRSLACCLACGVTCKHSSKTPQTHSGSSVPSARGFAGDMKAFIITIRHRCFYSTLQVFHDMILFGWHC